MNVRKINSPEMQFFFSKISHYFFSIRLDLKRMRTATEIPGRAIFLSFFSIFIEKKNHFRENPGLPAGTELLKVKIHVHYLK